MLGVIPLKFSASAGKLVKIDGSSSKTKAFGAVIIILVSFEHILDMKYIVDKIIFLLNEPLLFSFFEKDSWAGEPPASLL